MQVVIIAAILSVEQRVQTKIIL